MNSYERETFDVGFGLGFGCGVFLLGFLYLLFSVAF